MLTWYGPPTARFRRLATPDEFVLEVATRPVGTWRTSMGTPAAAAPLSSVTTTRIDDVVVCALAGPLRSSTVAIAIENIDRIIRDCFIVVPDLLSIRCCILGYYSFSRVSVIIDDPHRLSTESLA